MVIMSTARARVISVWLPAGSHAFSMDELVDVAGPIQGGIDDGRGPTPLTHRMVTLHPVLEDPSVYMCSMTILRCLCLADDGRG